MRRARIKRARLILGSSVVIACLASATLGGWRGLAGLLAGLLATSASLYGWWPVLGLLERVAVENRSPDVQQRTGRMGTTYMILIFLAKAPIFIALGLLARWLGGAAITCFLVGIGLVYSALIGWSQSNDTHSG
jgi:hypothetical protein